MNVLKTLFWTLLIGGGLVTAVQLGGGNCST